MQCTSQEKINKSMYVYIKFTGYRVLNLEFMDELYNDGSSFLLIMSLHLGRKD